MPIVRDTRSVEEKYLVVEQAEIDRQTRVYNALTRNQSKLLTAYQEGNSAFFVHPSAQLAAGQLLDADQAEIDALDQRWKQVTQQAEDAGLIHAAGGGYMVLAHPEAQLSHGIYHKIQWVTGNEHRLSPSEQREKTEA